MKGTGSQLFIRTREVETAPESTERKCPLVAKATPYWLQVEIGGVGLSCVDVPSLLTIAAALTGF